MSIIFSGLERVDQGSEDQLNWYYFDVTDVTTVNGEQNPTRLLIDADHEILLDQCYELEYEPSASTEIITTCERYLLNGQKMMVLENAVFFVPRMFFCFRPAYACQLSVRFIVKMLTGIEEPAGVNFVIKSNYKNLTRYFGNIKIIAEFVHTGKMLEMPSQFSSELVKQIVMSLVEYFSMQISDEFFNVAVSHLIQFGDSSSILNNDQQIRTCDENVYKNLKNTEICMFTSDFSCVICTQYFSKNTELKNHIKQHSQLACLECKIDFDSYEYLLVHKLTFCHAPCLLKNCLYCKKAACECNCAKMHRALQKAIKLWMTTEKENGALQIGLYSMIYQYGIQECDVFDLTKLPDEGEYEDWSQTEIDTIVASILPKIIVEADSIRMDDIRISFHKIKEILEEYFLSFEQFELYMLNFVIPIKENCGEKSCTEHFSKTHVLENHPICAFAKNLRSNEVPVRFGTKRELYLHLLSHKVLIKLPMRCKICHFKFKMLNNHLLISDVFNHAKNHHKQEKLNCIYNTELSCQISRPVGSIDEMLHNFMFHATETEILQVFQNLLTHDEGCSKSPGRKNSISFGNVHKQEVSDVPNITDYNSQNFLSQTGDNGDCQSLETKNKEHFACKNEKHSTPIIFSNELLLRVHIFESHKCPACKFSTMYDRDLLIHFKSHTEKNQEKCDICGIFVQNVKEHRERVHAKCSACKIFFVDLQQLKTHEPECSYLNNEGELHNETSLIQRNMASLEIDSSELESNFSQILIKILQKSDCNEQEKLIGANVIQKFASESTIAKNRARLENVSVRKSDASFFDTPNFRHTEKSNLPKVLTAIGTVSEKVKFDGKSENAKAQAVKNFEQFDVIFSRMDKNVLLGALNEIQAVSVLQLYLSQRIVDEISSYTNVEWKYLSYTEIIKSVQFLYIPLNLVIFQNIVLSYRIDRGESFLEFSSRVFRHLKLCSRLKSPEERDSYVEMHRCSILKNSLPPDTLNTITKKEQIYRAFSSQELLDHVISSYHLAGSGDETEQYHVFYTQKNASELSPAASQIRTLEQNNEQRKKPVVSSSPVDKNDKWKRDMNSSTKGRGGRGGYRNVGNRGFTNPKPDMRRDYQPDMRRDYPTNNRFPKLADIPRGTCVKCLSTQHFTPACNVYSHAAICREVCVVNSKPHGFHYPKDCSLKRDLSKPTRGRRPRSNFYQNRDKPSRVFRPFRIQK